MAVGLQIRNGDFVFLPSGHFNFVTGKEKASRDFYKMLCTEVESEENITGFYRYNPLYGTELHRKDLFYELTDKEALQLAQILIKQSIQNYIRLQEARKNLSVGEIITSITHNTYMVTDPQLGRKIVVDIQMSLATGETENLGLFEEVL